MSEAKVEENVLVATVGGRDLKADVYSPANPPRPVIGILMLPGGGWRNCDRSPLGERYGLALARDGFVCVAGEYRVMDEAPWPTQIQDVKANIRWMRANSAKLGIDQSLIVVAGKSAGGHLALLAAGTPNVEEFEGGGGNPGVSSEVAAVIGSSPVCDISGLAATPELEPMFGANPSAEVIAGANPMSYINGSYPPALIFHGTSDTRVDHGTTMAFTRGLEEKGVPFDLHLYAGQDHFFDRVPPFCEVVTDAIGLFISRYVPFREPAVIT